MQKAADHKIVKRRNGRYAVRKRGGGTINGREKIEILLAADLIKTKLPPEAPAEETAPVEAAAEAPAAAAEAPEEASKEPAAE